MRKYIIIALILLLSSCQDDPTKMDRRYTISREKFINVLIDIHTMDAIVNSPDYYRRYQPGDSVNLHQKIFDKYNITKAEFDSTIAAYTRRPDLYMKVYDEVILRLNLKLDQLRENEPSFEKPAEE